MSSERAPLIARRTGGRRSTSADRARHLCRWANEQRNCGPFQSGGAKSL